MATSGSVDFGLTESDLITAAAQEIRVLGDGETLSTEDYAICRKRLNMIAKAWSGNPSKFRGFQAWTRRRGTLFLAKDTSEYALGASGGNWTDSYVRTTLSAGEPISETSLAVASITGISNADYIGIELDDGTLHWDVVNGAPSGSNVTITTGLAAAAASGRYVYAYTTKGRNPMRILTAVLRDENSDDVPLTIHRTVEDYEKIGDKTADGDPTEIYFERDITNSRLFTNFQADDVTKQIRMVYQSEIEDFDANSNDLEFPKEWYMALMYELAVVISQPFHVPVSQELAGLRTLYLDIAVGSDPEDTCIYFQPGMDE